MCLDPVSMAVIGIGGSLIQGIGAANEKQTNAQSLDMQAAGLERDIAAEEQASAYEIANTRRTLARTLGAQRAGYAANGLALSGSAADVIQDTATEGDLDIAAIQWNSKVKVDNTKYQRDVTKRNAQTERDAAPLAFIAPVIGGVAKFGGAF